ncbi:TetR/AcrR family transcriptional regulator [Methylobacterium sp. 2A]|nr:TetR/AcrR family transcriptional regulator [Methylobacterium sp. 2A]
MHPMASEASRTDRTPTGEPTDADAHPVRRSPTQDRSAATVGRINAAAARLLGRGIPPHRLTTAQIAREAGVSVGALYRFFPDKEALVDALAAERFEAFEAALRQEIAPGLLAANGPALIARLVNAAAAYLEAHPDLRTLVFCSHRDDGETPSLRGHLGQTATAMIKRHLVEGLGMQDTPELDFRLRLAAEVEGHLLGMALAQPDPHQREAILDETKRLLSTYIFG